MAIPAAPTTTAALAVPPASMASLRRAEHLPTHERVKRIAYAIGILFPVLAFAAVRAFAAPIKAGAAAQMT